ncbi:MAG TPA: thymidine phosphorylase [Myxococcales bacterium]|nr:thymidine phosphorylase [Myxococcales bacterium]HIN86357.1 thymidine phosphorylase [Myxococcales bacterium]
MRFVDIIKKKRDGLSLTASEIDAVVRATLSDDVPDYQITAFLMAAFLKGMSPDERGWLTHAMTHSGDVLDFSHIDGKKVDKHSTGGVGDKVSLCLAPAVAACGVIVPMVSGRGLGHTGGTLDKLESIPGLQTRLSTERFKEVVQSCGMALAGQSADIAPADKRLYALRDVTGTVESLPLITASIMSKKLAEGLDGLVLDVKAGSGAFMKTRNDARSLAKALVDTGKRCGVATTAFITDMGQPLGKAVGHANEMAEAIAVLQGGGPADLVEITEILGGEMCVLGGVATSLADGRAQMRAVLDDGSALEKLKEVVAAQDGDPSVCDNPALLAQPNVSVPVKAQRSGYVCDFNTAAMGMAVIGMGGGRNTTADIIDPSVGLLVEVNRGDSVEAGQVLCWVQAPNQTQGDHASMLVGNAIRIDDNAPTHVPLVMEEIR